MSSFIRFIFLTYLLSTNSSSLWWRRSDAGVVTWVDEEVVVWKSYGYRKRWNARHSHQRPTAVCDQSRSDSRISFRELAETMGTIGHYWQSFVSSTIDIRLESLRSIADVLPGGVQEAGRHRYVPAQRPLPCGHHLRYTSGRHQHNQRQSWQ